jgi:hypothetical protein
MNRRGFFGRLCGAVAGLWSAKSGAGQQQPPRWSETILPLPECRKVMVPVVAAPDPESRFYTYRAAIDGPIAPGDLVYVTDSGVLTRAKTASPPIGMVTTCHTDGTATIDYRDML